MFDACYLDRRQRSQTRCGTLGDSDYKALDNKEVVRIKTSHSKTTRVDTEGQWTPHWYRMDRGRASKSEDSCGVIHFPRCFRSMQGSYMAASMFLVTAGRHWRWQPRFWTMVQWVATPYLSGLCNVPMAEKFICDKACQRTCGVSRTWPRCPIYRGPPSRTQETWKSSALCTSSPKSGAILSSSSPSSLFEVVANQVFCGSCGYIPHVCRNGQWWMHRNAAQIAGFTKSLGSCNHTQSGRDRPKSYCSKQCSYNSEVLGVKWAAEDICMSYLARAKQSSMYMVTKYGSWWLW